MKKILLYNVAAESGGAKTIMELFYNEYRGKTDCECFMVTSVLDYSENNRLHIIKLPWVKKSWFHRLYCDLIYMPRLVKKLKIDEILSLQNIGIPRCKVKQTVYVQNAIPFTDYRFSLFRDPFLWMYQNIIGKLTYISLKKANSIIVQSKWMKEEVAKRCKIPNNKVIVKRVRVNEPKDTERTIAEHPIFFYPASPYRYKNIEIVIEACKKLRLENIGNYEVVLTITGKENRLAESIAMDIKKNNLPIKLVGRLEPDQMADYYKKSILLYPSYLETVGLPLAEAKLFNAPIIAADCKYAHDVVDGYINGTFFSHTNVISLCNIMKKFIEDYGGRG